MANTGIYQTAKQCREKTEKLYMKVYKKIRGHKQNQNTSKWFNSLDQILGHRPAYSGNTATKDSATVLLEAIVLA